MPRQPKQPGEPNQPKRKKTIHGGGTVYQRSDGRYVASIKDPNTGKRIDRYAKTEKEAEKKLEDIKFEIRQGTLATGPNQTLEQYITRWYEDVQKYDVRETTFVRNRSILSKHIIPSLGHIQLKKLSAHHIQRFYASLLSKGMRPGSIKSIHSLLRKALKNAVRLKLVSSNVCDHIDPPRDKDRREIAQALTAEQALQLLNTSKDHALEPLIVLALIIGLRHGEIMALRWQDISFETKSLRVQRTVTRLWGQGYVETPPKTGKSKREIILPQYVIDVLLKHKLRQGEVKLQAGTLWEENNLVFSNTRGKYQDVAHTFRRFRKLLDQAGLPHIRIHDLRHSAASLLILVLKMPPKLVQEMLGHSSVGMTLDLYTHVDKSQQRKMMDAFDTFLVHGEEGKNDDLGSKF